MSSDTKRPKKNSQSNSSENTNNSDSFWKSLTIVVPASLTIIVFLAAAIISTQPTIVKVFLASSESIATDMAPLPIATSTLSGINNLNTEAPTSTSDLSIDTLSTKSISSTTTAPAPFETVEKTNNIQSSPDTSCCTLTKLSDSSNASERKSFSVSCSGANVKGFLFDNGATKKGFLFYKYIDNYYHVCQIEKPDKICTFEP